MISLPELRKISRERKLALDLIEKDYAIGWILFGISSSSLSDELVFKGGTALSKVYFPLGWRLSEDLDFTISERSDLGNISIKLIEELPGIVEKASGELLLNFKDKPRLKRAQRIKDKELTIQQETDNQIKALIRDYHIVIDLENRVVLHDCADWSRVLTSKRFCKHIGKLLLSLDKEKASNILKQIYANKGAWEFKPYTE